MASAGADRRRCATLGEPAAPEGRAGAGPERRGYRGPTNGIAVRPPGKA